MLRARRSIKVMRSTVYTSTHKSPLKVGFRQSINRSVIKCNKCLIKAENVFNWKTRMHSSGMRTARLLTVSQHPLRRSVCIPACIGQGMCIQHALGRGCLSQHARGGGFLPRGVSAQEVSPQGGGVCPEGVCPAGVCLGGVSAQGCIPACIGADIPRGQTDTCENVTFANFLSEKEKKFWRNVALKNLVLETCKQ